MAQAVRAHHDIHSLWSQAKAGNKLQCPATDHMSIVGQLGARDLTIVWADDKRYWEWKTMEIGGQSVEVAELLKVCWLEIDGKYSVQKLTEGINYEVKFLVKLLNNFNIDKPVNLSLTTPDGCKQDRTENMMQMPRNQIIAISAGEFQAQKACGCGEIKFSMMNTDGFWKHGLVVIGALIAPKF